MGKTTRATKTKSVKEIGIMANNFLDDSNFQRVQTEILKLVAGSSFIGKLTDITERPWLDRETGEVMTITQYHFVGAENKLFVYFGDSGFKNLMWTNNVKKGDVIKIVKLDKKSVSGTNREYNDYELYKSNAAH